MIITREVEFSKSECNSDSKSKRESLTCSTQREIEIEILYRTLKTVQTFEIFVEISSAERNIRKRKKKKKSAQRVFAWKLTSV